MEVIPYLPLPAEVLRQIVDGKLARLINLLKQRFNAEINVEESVATEILRRASRAEMVRVFWNLLLMVRYCRLFLYYFYNIVHVMKLSLISA